MPVAARAHRNPGAAPELSFFNADLYNPCTGDWDDTSFSIGGGRICTLGAPPDRDGVDLKGARVIPGLIDAHVHVESSLLTPAEFGRLVLRHGVTTVVADPHEIANVLGTNGIRYMLIQEENTPLDIFFMLPSCVPASPADLGGATLSAEDLVPFLPHEKVLGLGEVMDVGAVLSGDTEMKEKLRLTCLIDGHAPGLSGVSLDQYIGSGIQSDHECTQIEEAREKLEKGMYIMIREGSTEQNLAELIPLANLRTLPRLSFATDDRHARTLSHEGSIDDCIRKALSAGVELEMALRMATLSPCERFGLLDRGMLTPGKLADFCILERDDPFRVARTFKRGVEVSRLPYRRSAVVGHPVWAPAPDEYAFRLSGAGTARVMRLQPGQILTRTESVAVEGDRIPDLDRDILILVVCSRYRPGRYGVGLVQGFGLQEGALAGSVAHDAHNVVAVGADWRSLKMSLEAVISRKGGMAAVSGGNTRFLPLDCAGLMSSAPFEEVVENLHELDDQVERMGGIEHAFMYLSFLTLTVIPELRLTEKGLFDVASRTWVPLFIS